ncbi:MAG TPA: thiol reductant ABC exporter subunit CydD [Streptosporangiaceae bacterium]|nr:thiol reductant ABC exporter subunit CydD [Streptosporangiaceae bacterium]
MVQLPRPARLMTAGHRTRPVDPRLLRHAGAARGYLTATVALGLAGTGLILAQAGLLARALAGAAAGVSVTALRGPLIALALVLLARAAVSYGGEVAALRAAAAVKSQLRRGLISQALALGPAWLAGGPGHREGELATLATRGLDGLDAYFARYLPQLVLAILVPLAVLARVAAADWLSALIIAVTLPLVPVFAVLTGLHTRARTQRQWALLARLGGHFLDVVEGLPTLRVFGRARAQEAEVSALTGQYAKATMGTLRIAFLSALVLELAAALATALVAVEVGLRLLGGHLSYQTALLVLLLTPEAFLPLRSAGAQFHASIEGVTAAAGALEVLETPLPAGRGGPPRPAAARPDLRRHTITLTGVSLGYPGRPAPALSGLDLEIQPGDHLTVTGPSGAGKSSLLALLLRFAEPTAGTIQLSGPGLAPADLADIPAAAWRDQLAWVPQRTHLFDDTVAGNIALGRPGASPDDIRHAARLAGADGFITALDDGYRTPVGERGHRLSAGQRQKIAIARAFLRDAPFLLLDEPAAHLDPFSAAAVQEALAALMAGRTVVHVTHLTLPCETNSRRLALARGRVVTATAGLGEPTGLGEPKPAPA